MRMAGVATITTAALMLGGASTASPETAGPAHDRPKPAQVVVEDIRSRCATRIRSRPTSSSRRVTSSGTRRPACCSCMARRDQQRPWRGPYRGDHAGRTGRGLGAAAGLLPVGAQPRRHRERRDAGQEPGQGLPCGPEAARGGRRGRRLAHRPRGHDYGAMYGALLADSDERVSTMVLQAPDAEMGNWFATFWLGSRPGAGGLPRPVRRAGPRGPRREARLKVLFQWAGDDMFIPAEVRAAYAASSPRRR